VQALGRRPEAARDKGLEALELGSFLTGLICIFRMFVSSFACVLMRVCFVCVRARVYKCVVCVCICVCVCARACVRMYVLRVRARVHVHAFGYLNVYVSIFNKSNSLLRSLQVKLCNEALHIQMPSRIRTHTHTCANTNAFTYSRSHTHTCAHTNAFTYSHSHAHMRT
jgi:hypothetical protein